MPMTPFSSRQFLRLVQKVFRATSARACRDFEIAESLARTTLRGKCSEEAEYGNCNLIVEGLIRGLSEVSSGRVDFALFEEIAELWRAFQAVEPPRAFYAMPLRSHSALRQPIWFLEVVGTCTITGKPAVLDGWLLLDPLKCHNFRRVLYSTGAAVVLVGETGNLPLEEQFWRLIGMRDFRHDTGPLVDLSGIHQRVCETVLPKICITYSQSNPGTILHWCADRAIQVSPDAGLTALVADTAISLLKPRTFRT